MGGTGQGFKTHHGLKDTCDASSSITTYCNTIRREACHPALAYNRVITHEVTASAEVSIELSLISKLLVVNLTEPGPVRVVSSCDVLPRKTLAHSPRVQIQQVKAASKGHYSKRDCKEEQHEEDLCTRLGC